MSSVDGAGNAAAPNGQEDDYFSRKKRLLAVLFQSVISGPVAHEAARACLRADVLAACKGVSRAEAPVADSLSKSCSTTKGGCDRTGANACRTTQKSKAASRGGGRRHNAEGSAGKNRSKLLHVSENRASATVASKNETSAPQIGSDGGRKRKFYDEQLPVGVYRHQQKYVANWVDPKTRRQIKVCFPIDVWGDSQARNMAAVARRERCVDVDEVAAIFNREERTKTSGRHPSPSRDDSKQTASFNSAVRMPAVQGVDSKTETHSAPALESA
ncbi:unnamed protein product [Neospora caninum Liverpool]|uniref:AP2 domain transcription factor AP2XII-6 n=1 Tax=Neospora caninum (strain Liverpool) TaxID=572307 RepID=F0VQW7_NEOCL|nr:uncharacterized protein NCLIV_065400 [Neospora caninum Liverpool]CBZ56114.1 unnamed protein product [Neospora caninum Liverpool]CEL70869.1 TPA: AP2 domain transcription factor AP2XII-6 [Neospora caninum Liverpool]|eukprot:XP_003886140.1 uncharacterized protein NCLIV_065400 [Neospora caninum Liverpool]